MSTQVRRRRFIHKHLQRAPATAALGESTSVHVRQTKRFARRRSGSATVECAVVLPVFVMITLATIEACSMIFLRQSLEIAAYEGARAAIVPGTDQDDVQQKCLVLAAARGVNGTSASVTPSNFQNAAYGTFIKVTVTAPCDANGLLAPLFYANQTITAEVEMMNEY